MSAKTFPGGDILFDMNSAKAAAWIKRGDIHIEFMQGFSAMSAIKGREHSCIVKNVPVSFHPSLESTLEVESTNDLPPSSILLVQWIKPIENRYEGQCTAFMIITFRTTEAANTAIQNNLYIVGKRCT